MKRQLTILVLVALAAVSSWVVLTHAPPASGAVASTAAPTMPQQVAADSTRDHAAAAVDVAAAATAADRQRQSALEIESAILSNDAGRRETALFQLLPDLLGSDPARVVDLVARQPRGDSRDALLHEVARTWITRDTEAAVAWLQSLGEEREASARIAVHALAAVSPAQAIDVADRLDVGRDDGSVEHILQIWAAESPREARRWLENQPDSPRIALLRARLPP